jgi:transcriptional regulator with XRE-family HTH domain
MAIKLNISQNSYSKFESGKIKMDEKKLASIASVLGVDPDVIKNYSDQMVFNNCTNSGNYNRYTFNESVDKIFELFEKSDSEKDAKIKFLEDLIVNNNEQKDARIKFLEEMIKVNDKSKSKP